MPADKEAIPSWRPTDSTFRVEWRRSKYWSRWPVTHPTGTGHGGSFSYYEDAENWARQRSAAQPGNEYRIVSAKQVHAHFKAGIRVPAPIKEGAIPAVEGSGSVYRVEFYASAASYGRPGPHEGPNAPSPDPSKWVSGYTGSLDKAQAQYRKWTESKSIGTYKCARIVEYDATITTIIRVIRQSNGQETTVMAAPNVEPTKPYEIDKNKAIEVLEAAVEQMRAKHEEEQQKQLDDHAASIAKVEQLAANPYLVLRMFENRFGKTTDYEDAAAVEKTVGDYYGAQPGTAEFVVPPQIQEQINVLRVINNDTLEIQPTDNLFDYLKKHESTGTSGSTSGGTSGAGGTGGGSSSSSAPSQ